MRPLLILTFLLSGCSEARAPELNGYAFVVRIAYVADLDVNPYHTRSRCEVTRAFTEKELPDLPGYHKIVACMPVNR
jgi:hypothetical protein